MYNALAWKLAKSLTCLIFNKKKREQIQLRIVYFIHGRKVKKHAQSCGQGLKVLEYSKVTSHTILGEGVSLNGLKINGCGKVTIGNYCHFAPETVILTENHSYESDKIPYNEVHICREVIIEDFVWVGFRAIILPGAHIGEGAIIQAGAVVHGEIPPYAIAGGNPAKVFKYRDAEHFKELKEKGAFY